MRVSADCLEPDGAYYEVTLDFANLDILSYPGPQHGQHPSGNKWVRHHWQASCKGRASTTRHGCFRRNKTGPSYGCGLANKFGIPLYCTDDDPERIKSFDGTKYDITGGLSDLLSVSDIVIDCAPGKLGEANHQSLLENWDKTHLPRGGETRPYRAELYYAQITIKI